MAQINPQHPTGLVPQRKDQQYDGIQQLKKPLNWPNATEADDFKDIYNPNKQPDPGCYSQSSEPNPVPINGSSDYETYNNANLSGRPSVVKEQNGADDVRTMSNRWEGNPEYKSSYDYTPNNNSFKTESIKPKYLNAQVSEPNPVPINGSSDYEKYNNANLSGRPSVVKEQNGADDVRTMSNRWEGNPEYKSSYDYTPNNNSFKTESIKPKYLNAQISEPNPVPINGSSDYETYNNANLSGRPSVVKEQNGADDFRTMSNRWEGNPEYKSAYDYTPNNNSFKTVSIKPKYTN